MCRSPNYLVKNGLRAEPPLEEPFEGRSITDGGSGRWSSFLPNRWRCVHGGEDEEREMLIKHSFALLGSLEVQAEMAMKVLESHWGEGREGEAAFRVCGELGEDGG
ncbi:hypothetical protein AXF42_Ash016340 [Apostasia shenzhenica]|uniref:Uncharacterized protein n=1 Tax=Apostasia shenzhenica TaxID=1088818 RepID=A0A2H9ZXJ1_9ASPA|nr:hypothetical protein AXF42_Ash016340 [Apostasia shenzhenica]